MAELICVVCPRSCHLVADDDLNITGNNCERGEAYAKKELEHPVRTVTSTVRISGAALCRCPVRTRSPIPKSLIFDAMQLLDSIDLTAPVEEGFVVIEDICGTRIPFITTRGLAKV